MQALQFSQAFFLCVFFSTSSRIGRRSWNAKPLKKVTSPCWPPCVYETIATIKQASRVDTSRNALLIFQISELDKLVARVKQQQANCLISVDGYEKELGHIATEVKNIMDRYGPLVKRLAQRQQERAELEAQQQQITQQFGDILSTTKKQLRKSSHEHLQHIRHEANKELAGARGYSLGKDSTAYQKHRK